jgi:hypothetical protein
MRKAIIFLLFVLAAAGCSKPNSDVLPTNTDVTGDVFRVVANSDVNYSVSIIISTPGNAAPDTLSVSSSGNSQFSYGFHAVQGMVITVTAATAAGATKLQCQPLYKSVLLTPVNFITNSNGSMDANFTYTVTN